jgi:predicted transcriptional regulator
MDMESAVDETNYVELTAEVVSAYVMHNAVQKTDLAGIISSVHASLLALSQVKPAPEAERPTPAVPIKKSIGQDYLISLEDGRRYKSLKRHLSGRGLTPEKYREKWGLPSDYPMVAPSYARQRSELAKSMGLGRQRRREEPEVVEQAAPAPKGRRVKNAA